MTSEYQNTLIIKYSILCIREYNHHKWNVLWMKPYIICLQEYMNSIVYEHSEGILRFDMLIWKRLNSDTKVRILFKLKEVKHRMYNIIHCKFNLESMVILCRFKFLCFFTSFYWFAWTRPKGTAMVEVVIPVGHLTFFISVFRLSHR